MGTSCKHSTSRVRRITAPPIRARGIRLLLLAAVMLLGCTSRTHEMKDEADAQNAPAAAADQVAEALAQFNHGAALLEQYRCPEAAKAFAEVLQVFPNWTAARFNLGLAYLSEPRIAGEKKRENLEKARQAFEEVLTLDPNHLHARFLLGLYYQDTEQNGKALECFEKVQQSDSDDPFVAYKCAEALLGLERRKEAVRELDRVVALDPGFVSAYYRLGTEYRLTRQGEKMAAMLARFKELKDVELAWGSYEVSRYIGNTGKYYVPLDADSLPLSRPETRGAPRVLFSPQVKEIDARTKAWKWAGGTVDLPGIAVGDLDGDGDLDLVLTAVGEAGSTSVWFNDGEGTFSPGPEIADRGVSPCLGDVNNDGHLDLWLGRAGLDYLLLNEGRGRFNRAPYGPVRDDSLVTGRARLMDLDSDGDLDLLSLRWRAGSDPARGRTVPASSALYRNNRDGTYADITTPLHLGFPEIALATLVYDDFDNDRDLDLILFPVNGKPIAWVNDRVGKYHILDAQATGLSVEGVVGAASGDPNKDGKRDLLIFTGKEVRLFLSRGRFRFEEDKEFAAAFGSLGGTGGQFADMDNDGDLDIVIPDAHRRDGTRGPVLLLNDWHRHRFLDAAQVDPGNLLAAIQTKENASCVAADFTGDGKCDILLAPIGEKPTLIENATPGGHWIELDLCGTRPGNKTSRSANSAVGTRVEVRTGTVFQQMVVGTSSGSVAMPPLRIHFGLGDNSKVDWLRMSWPDGALQAEMEVPADRVVRIAEVSRKTNSCPHLFAWTGSNYELVSDFGGVGGLGYLIAPGIYAKPDPTEYLPIPRLQPRGGEYMLQITEPLEEVVYLDEVKLIAVDHPAGTEVYPNEMMAVNVPPPPFELLCFKEPIDPVRAVNHRGEDVTEEIGKIDRRYAGATDPDGRFKGFAKDHFVELDFGDRLSRLARDARLVLFLYGWVDYAYSSSNYAASQAGMRLKAPSIHVLRDGRWVEVFHEVGYPAGLQHMMTLDGTGRILPGDRKIRISSNMDLYWDRIFLAEHLPSVPLLLKEVPAKSADLHFLGYPREYSPDGRRPNLYDYSNVDRTASWKLMDGDYTRYGEVGELLKEVDDCCVIMGHGEEVTLRFPADAFRPVAEGRRRTFILKTDSYCKDMDLYTAHSDAVEPLPFHAMSGYPYGPNEHYPDNEKTRAYRRLFNTRRVHVR